MMLMMELDIAEQFSLSRGDNNHGSAAFEISKRYRSIFRMSDIVYHPHLFTQFTVHAKEIEPESNVY